MDFGSDQVEVRKSWKLDTRPQEGNFVMKSWSGEPLLLGLLIPCSICGMNGRKVSTLSSWLHIPSRVCYFITNIRREIRYRKPFGLVSRTNLKCNSYKRRTNHQTDWLTYIRVDGLKENTLWPEHDCKSPLKESFGFYRREKTRAQIRDFLVPKLASESVRMAIKRWSVISSNYGHRYRQTEDHPPLVSSAVLDRLLWFGGFALIMGAQMEVV